MQAAHMTFEEEVLKSRVELRHLRIENANLKRANELFRKKVVRLERENQAPKQENRLLKAQQVMQAKKQAELEAQVENLNLIVEELRTMVFGKKHGKKDNSTAEQPEATGKDNDTQSKETKKRKTGNRSADSYRRGAPQEEAVTETIEHPLSHCPNCGTLLIAIKEIIRYREDIADLTMLGKLLKKIEKHIITSGYCSGCKRRKIAKSITPQISTLGENIKQFVCYLSIIMRLSFEQIRWFLADTAGIHLSDGEITACLDEQADELTPEREKLLQKIRGAPGRHYDETGWKTMGGFGNYCWINTGTEGAETIFLMGRSRGKGNAEELQGAVDNQVGISDDYGAYTNLFQKHQLCNAHPNRKLRDLRESKTLSKTSRAACDTSYQAFNTLYAHLEETLATPYEKTAWLQKREKYIRRLQAITIPTTNDPQKLKAIKQSLHEKAEKYFTCLTQPGIPADNNKAERGLRHIILKRKISYGSKSQKGADTMSILSSTLLSAWWNKPDNFFLAYKQMLSQ